MTMIVMMRMIVLYRCVLVSRIAVCDNFDVTICIRAVHRVKLHGFDVAMKSTVVSHPSCLSRCDGVGRNTVSVMMKMPYTCLDVAHKHMHVQKQVCIAVYPLVQKKVFFRV